MKAPSLLPSSICVTSCVRPCAGPVAEARWRRLVYHPRVANLVLPRPAPAAPRDRGRRGARRAAHGHRARRILRRVLLVSDGAPVLWRGHEPLLDCRRCDLRRA